MPCGRSEILKINNAVAYLCVQAIGLLWGATSHAATLSAVPAPLILPAGADNLSPATDLGMPSPFWFIPFVDWEQTGEASIQVAVTSPTDDPGTPVLHSVFLTIKNSTPDVWDRFELDVSGPATFSGSAPTQINLPANPPSLTPNSLVFSGFEMEPDGFTPTITFGLDVVPPTADEQLLLTLRPVAKVPEPTTGVLFAAGLLAVSRSRRRA